MRMGRRALFFLGVMATCLVMIPATPAEFRWVNYSMAGLALFWGIAAGIEDMASRREGRRHARQR